MQRSNTRVAPVVEEPTNRALSALLAFDPNAPPGSPSSSATSSMPQSPAMQRRVSDLQEPQDPTLSSPEAITTSSQSTRLVRQATALEALLSLKPKPLKTAIQASVFTLNIPVQSYADKVLETRPMWHFMGFQGLENFEKPFQAQAGDVEVARQHALACSCTRVRIDARHSDDEEARQGLERAGVNYRILSPLGNDINEMNSYPFFFREKLKLMSKFNASRVRLREFGCSVAISLYLRFNVEFAAVFVIAFLFSIPNVIDNTRRNALRNRCRSALLIDYVSLTSNVSSSIDGWYETCGFSGLPVRENIEILPGDFSWDLPGREWTISDILYGALDVVLNGPLTFALGTCEEYSDASDHSMPVPYFTEQNLFVRVPKSEFCPGDLTAMCLWCGLAVVLLFVGMLIYLRWRVRRVAAEHDHSMWTTADYAVLLRGLRHGLDETAPDDERMTADDLRVALFRDLVDMGFPVSCIKQIEPGRKCAREIALMKKLEQANIRRHELAARRAYAEHEKAHPNTPARGKSHQNFERKRPTSSADDGSAMAQLMRFQSAPEFALTQRTDAGIERPISSSSRTLDGPDVGSALDELMKLKPVAHTSPPPSPPEPMDQAKPDELSRPTNIEPSATQASMDQPDISTSHSDSIRPPLSQDSAEDIKPSTVAGDLPSVHEHVEQSDATHSDPGHQPLSQDSEGCEPSTAPEKLPAGAQPSVDQRHEEQPHAANSDLTHPPVSQDSLMEGAEQSTAAEALSLPDDKVQVETALSTPRISSAAHSAFSGVSHGLADVAGRAERVVKDSTSRVTAEVVNAKTKTEQVVKQAATRVADNASLTVDDSADGLAEQYIELNSEMNKIMADLEDLYQKPSYATGHAFVTFHYEKDKQRFLQKMRAAGVGASRKTRLGETQSTSTLLLRRTAGLGVRPLTAEDAPEPSDVNWAALEYDDATQGRMSMISWFVTTLLLIGSVAAIVTVRIAKEREQERQKENDDTGIRAKFVLYGLLLGLSSITAVTNFVLKVVITFVTDLEACETKTEHEASLFRKLSVAYVVNSAFIPIFVGVFFSASVNSVALDQSWFEKNGACGQAWLLLIISAFGKDLQKVFPIDTWIRRRFMVARSQAKLNDLWKPPKLYIGELYANTLKTCSLGLTYGPLYPICYLWVAFALIFCNVCTSYGISRWYARPPAVDEEMMMALRYMFGAILLGHVVMYGAAAHFGFHENFGAGLAFRAQLPAFVFAPAAWVCYAVLPLGCCRAFQKHDGSAGDTGGIAYDDVARLKGYEVDPYICPKITERIYKSVKRTQSEVKLEKTEAARHAAKSNPKQPAAALTNNAHASPVERRVRTSMDM